MDRASPLGSAAALLSRAIRSCGDSFYVDPETMALVRLPLAAVLLVITAGLIVFHVMVAAGLTGFHHYYGATGLCFALLRCALVAAFQVRIIYRRVRRAQMQQQQLPPPPPPMDMVEVRDLP